MPIRITPLIDVVFILLVFFMLTTRLLPVDYLELGNNTDNRGTASGEPLPELVVTADGTINWRDNHYRLSELLPALSEARITEANLSTSPKASLASFTQALSALDNAGIQAQWQRNNTDS